MKQVAAVFVLGLFVATLGVAGTTGRLTGTVREGEGQPLPGATVTVSSPTEIGGVKILVTDAEGDFQFPVLSPGYYTVRFELSGFVAQERNEVQVRLDRTTQLNVEMPLASFAEEMTVLDETPMVDPAQVSAAQTFKSEFLEGAALTSDRRDYRSVLNMAAGVSTPLGFAGDSLVYGSSIYENAYLIDGMNTTDPAAGDWGSDLPFDAIQEISLQTGGFEPEYGSAIGGVVNVVTKSGGNEFSGSFDARYYSSSFYQNGDHFNRDTNKVEFLNPAATLGGPIVHDRLWFFAAYEYTDSQSTPVLSPTTSQQKAATYLGKLTWQAAPRWRLTGKWYADPQNIDNSNASEFVAPEATYGSKLGGAIYSADASGVLRANLLWNLGIGINRINYDVFPQSGDFDTAGHYNDVSGEHYVNALDAYYSSRDRNQYKTDLSWFVDNFAGAHELKIGIEHSDLSYQQRGFALAGGFYYEDFTSDAWYEDGDSSPIPYLMIDTFDPGNITSTGKQETVYLQDAWKVRPNLTLKIGARYDQVAYDNVAGTKIADLSKLQPRFGLAWDLTGDAKNLFRASWGRYMHPATTALPDYARVGFYFSQWSSCSTILGVTSPAECRAEAASLGQPWIAGPDGWDPNGWSLAPSDVFGSEPTRIAAGLDPPYADELIVGFEREIARRTSVELSYVDKRSRSFFEDSCQGNLNGLTRADDGYCSYYIVSNFPGIRRDYQAAILKLETRATDWLWLLASYTWSKSKASINGTLGANADFDVCPELCVNRYGYRIGDARHQVKLNGYFLLPADFKLGVDAFWSSPFPYARTQPLFDYGGQAFLEPRGSRRANSNYQLDLSLTHHLDFGKIGVALIGSVANVLNSERPIAVCENIHGCGSYAFSDPTQWQTPRRFEVGLRVEF